MEPITIGISGGLDLILCRIHIQKRGLRKIGYKRDQTVKIES